MPKGGHKKSPATRFGGPRGNIPGKTGLQREMEILNAQKATQIRARLLEALNTSLDTTPELTLNRIEANVLKLLKDSEDRGLGTPKASIDLSNEDGSLRREPIVQHVTAYLSRKHDAKADPKTG
jgi:hypothetical protein